MENNGLDLEIQKELEMELEKSKLEEVLDIISNEILTYIGKRKEVGEQILKYREKFLEEYRDDEDKVAEYFDHEKFVKEESFKNIDRKLKELIILKQTPYFGRVDFKDEEFGDNERIYIGRFGVTPEESLEPVVVDWRSPVASLFYTARLGKSTYEAPIGKVEVDILKKRQFIVKKEQLLGMFDSDMDVKDEILQMVLSSNSGDKLKDIIMTIQEEQDNIIRHPKYGTVVVNGVAGSGKTTIALHRVAYLLYNYRASLQDKVLILGPNNIFMEYISQVLPSLGEVGVNQTTFVNFAFGLLEAEEIMEFKDYMERIVNDDKEFIEASLHKNSAEYIKELDEFLLKQNNELFNYTDIYFEDILLMKAKEMEELFTVHYVSMPLFRRSRKVKRIIFSRLKEARDEKVKEIERKYREEISKMNKTELELNDNQLRMYRRIKIRDVIKKVMELRKDLRYLNGKKAEELYHVFNHGERLTQDDLAPILYFKLKLEGARYGKEVKHIVIDEAQDYSELQFRVIKELTGCSAFTIVGDSNQRIIPLKGELPMLKLEGILSGLDIKSFRLEKSYRSTKEIMEYANRFLSEEKVVPVIRSGEQVEEKFFESKKLLADQLMKTMKRLKDKGYENIGIICKNIAEVEMLGDIISNQEHIKVFRKEDIAFGEGVMLIPSYFAKGLEFDAAILVENNVDEKFNKLSYVMATRALHELYVYKKPAE